MHSVKRPCDIYTTIVMPWRRGLVLVPLFTLATRRRERGSVLTTVLVATNMAVRDNTIKNDAQLNNIHTCSRLVVFVTCCNGAVPNFYDVYFQRICTTRPTVTNSSSHAATAGNARWTPGSGAGWAGTLARWAACARVPACQSFLGCPQWRPPPPSLPLSQLQSARPSRRRRSARRCAAARLPAPRDARQPDQQQRGWRYRRGAVCRQRAGCCRRYYRHRCRHLVPPRACRQQVGQEAGVAWR